MNRPAPSRPHEYDANGSRRKPDSTPPSPHSSKTLSIIAIILGSISMIPFLGVLSAPALILAIIALFRKEPFNIAFAALMVATLGVLTSPSLLLIASGPAFIGEIKQEWNASEPTQLADICGEEVRWRSSIAVGERTCKLNRWPVDCDLYDTYDSDDIIRCNDDQTSLLPGTKKPVTKDNNEVKI